MNQRDKAIIQDLTRFRVMSRDDVIDLHFGNVKHPVVQANMVLKRLRRDDHISCSKERRQYLYFPNPSIKKDSAKINHFLAIVDFYKELGRVERPKVFEVEPKYGKGQPEPDVFMIWQRAPFYVEIQRSVYSEKVMKEKIQRYEQYYYSDQWKLEAWQPEERKVFPRLWILSETGYNIIAPFKCVQSKTVAEMIDIVSRR